MNLLSNLKEKNKDFLKKENFYFLFLSLTIFIFDRFTKQEIINNFNKSIYYINDYINFDLIWNIGIGFGFLSTDSSIFYNLVTFTVGIVIVFLLYISVQSENIDKFIYSIIIGEA